MLFLPLVPLSMGEAGLLVTCRCTDTSVICFHWSLLLAYFSPIFLPPLPFSDLSSHSPHILTVVFLVSETSCFFMSDLFGNLSSFILTMCPAHFILLLTILPTIQALVPTSSRRSFIILLSTHFTSGYSSYPVVLTYL